MPAYSFLDFERQREENRLLKRQNELLRGAAQFAKVTIKDELCFGPIERSAFEKVLKQLKDAGV